MVEATNWWAVYRDSTAELDMKYRKVAVWVDDGRRDVVGMVVPSPKGAVALVRADDFAEFVCYVFDRDRL